MVERMIFPASASQIPFWQVLLYSLSEIKNWLSRMWLYQVYHRFVHRRGRNVFWQVPHQRVWYEQLIFFNFFSDAGAKALLADLLWTSSLGVISLSGWLGLLNVELIPNFIFPRVFFIIPGCSSHLTMSSLFDDSISLEIYSLLFFSSLSWISSSGFIVVVVNDWTLHVPIKVS